MDGAHRPNLPCVTPGVWARSDVASVVNDYSSWLTESDVPKLFVNADPGCITYGQ
jgi:haloalkane dehalogenase